MENIKFRQFLKDAYRKNGESFHYWGYISDGFVSPVGKNISDFEGAQYTGIKDKNGEGEEMCFGDIVYAAGHGNGVVVKNYYGEWGLNYAEGFIPIHDLIMEKDLGEIKGNVHENPELLGKSNA